MTWDGVAENWGKGHYRDVPISKYVKLCRERHIRDLKRAEARDPDFPYYFDQEAADKAVWFMRLLRHFKGKWAGQRFELSDWQEWDIIRPLFGWRRADGTRRFRDAFIAVARKNGKSFIAGAIANYLLSADQEYGAEVYCAATKEDQARIVWDAAKKMAFLAPEVRPHLKAFKRSIVNEFLGSKLVPLGRDSKTLDGLDVHGAIIDEYHAHKTPEIYNVLASARGAREQPLITIITTYGYGTDTACKKEDDYARRVLEGVLQNETYFAFIACCDNPQDWENEEEWYKANPNLGISISLEKMRDDYNKAKDSPQEQAEFKAKRLNIWVGKAHKWLKPEVWNRCNGLIDQAKLKGKRCFAGLDLGISRDISALALAFLDEDAAIKLIQPEQEAHKSPHVTLLMRYWVPEVGLHERWKMDGVNYPQWRDEGWIVSTPGETTKYDFIREEINKLSEEFNISEIAVDRAHAHQLMKELEDDEFTICKHSQNFLAMNGPCRAFEELVIEGRIRHGNDPVLRWMAANAVIVKDAHENIKVVKDKSEDRVDGLIAAIMAVGRLLIAPAAEVPVYQSRGLVVL